MKKAIVTGANGFVGLAVCKELVKHGVEVLAVIRENGNTRGLEKLEGVRLLYCDLLQYKNLNKLFDDRDVDCFYHFAWVGSAGTLRGDYDVQLDNIRATCEAVQICNDIKCKHFVFPSSIMEYEVQSLMKSEVPPDLSAIYSTSKASANYMARTLANKYGITYIRCVISNIYGPGETSPRIINTSIRKMINGEHCAFSAGLQMYDFIYVDDAAKAFVELGDKGINNRTYYIGSLNPRPLKDYLLEMKDAINPNLEVGLGELPYNGISLSYDEFDIWAVKKDTGLEPEVGFTDGIRKTVKWIEGEKLDKN